jgi:DNA invertase Pin-like site-specific DNA recombinase
LEAQRAAIAVAAKRLGQPVAQVFEDAGISGAAPIDQRPGLLAAVNALRKGDVLMVAKRDRLGRDVIAVALVERLVQRKGARIVSAAGEGTDTDDPSSMLLRRLVDCFGEYERAMIRARTKAALKAKRARGERAGNVPFGYRVAEDGRTLLQDAREQQVIALARSLRAEGLTLRGVAAALRERQVVGRTGRPLGLAQVHALIAPPAQAA